MNTTHDYTDEQLQAAIDAAFPAGARPEGFNLDNRPSSIDWKLEAPNRLAIARAFLAALPKSKPKAVAADEGAPATSDSYARLKAYAAAGARIRCTSYGGHWTDWALNKHAAWSWCKPVDQYEVHPDDLHMVPEYAPGTEVEKPWMSEARQIAAQCWCDPETSGTPMDGHLAEAVAKRIQAWMETSAQNQRNADYYRSLVVRCGRAMGEQAYIADDGGKHEDVLCAKVPELVEGLVAKIKPLPAEVSAEPEKAAEEKPCGLNSALDEWSADDGPQAASKADEPATFEAHGKTWTRHMPGDPCPCDLRASVYVAFKDGTFSGRPGLAVNWAWGTYLPDSEWLIGWRYADEPAQAEQATAQPWTPKPGDVVRLKSGGPEMTVEAPNKDSNTFCSWFDGNGINQRFFPAACLTPVKKLQS